MISESKIISELVIPHFKQLGYPTANFVFEYVTPFGRIADLLLRDHNFEPYIVVEVKSHLKDLSLELSSKKFQYNPLVQQAHQAATSLDAPYFVITDGHSFTWFRSGETGRPEFIEREIHFKEPIEQKKASQKKISNLLRTLRNIIAHSDKPNLEDSLTAILLKVYSEQEEILDVGFAEIKSILTHFHLIPKDLDILGIKDAFNVLEGFRLTSIPGEVLFDEIFKFFSALNIKGGEFQVPKWISELLVSLADIHEGDQVYNPNFGFGEILGAISYQSQDKTIDLIGQSVNNDCRIWALLQCYLLGNRVPELLIGNPPIEGIQPNKVICSPPFGSRSKSLDVLYPGKKKLFIDTRNSEAQYLQAALSAAKPNSTLIFLMPESFFFRGGRDRDLRKKLIQEFSVDAVLRLPPRAFNPFTSIDTSIIIIRKTSPPRDHLVFMGFAQNPLESKISTWSSISEINEIISQYLDWRKKPKEFNYESLCWSAKSTEFSNYDYVFSVNRYAPIDLKIEESFETIPLKELIFGSPKKGRSIPLSDDGDQLVLTPASIRKLNIPKSDFKRTKKEEIPSNAIFLERNDIVINSLGTYLGSAALISEEFASSIINQHVTIIKPNSQLILPGYLAIALNSDYVQSQIRNLAVGVTMAALPIKLLSTIQIPVPSLQNQHEIIEQIQQHQEKINTYNNELRKATTNLEHIINNLGIQK